MTRTTTWTNPTSTKTEQATLRQTPTPATHSMKDDNRNDIRTKVQHEQTKSHFPSGFTFPSATFQIVNRS